MTEQRILRSIRRHLKASYTALRVTGEAGEDGYWEVHRQVKRNRLKTGDSPVGERFMVTRNGDLNPADLPRWAKLSRARGRRRVGLEDPYYVCGDCGQTSWDTMAEAEACAKHDQEMRGGAQ